jgi:hypothetical protein
LARINQIGGCFGHVSRGRENDENETVVPVGLQLVYTIWRIHGGLCFSDVLDTCGTFARNLHVVKACDGGDI